MNLSSRVCLCYFWLASLIALMSAIIDDKILEKDLYAVLGVSKRSTVQEIKKAFKELARIHHPDKSTKSNREANAEIFRQVAEAYEILSDTNLRQEYDTYRYNVKETRRPSSSPSQQSPSTYQTPDARNNPFDYNLGDMFRNLFSYDYDYSFEPILARQYFPSGEIIYPYSCLIISDDYTHFVLLDGSCSLLVFKGNPDTFIRHISSKEEMNKDHLDALGIFLMYHTPSRLEYGGQCYMTLDSHGSLIIFGGSPGFFMNSGNIIWQSPAINDEQNFYSHYVRYYLELSNNGEFSVQRLQPGRMEGECVWSTISCQNSLLKMIPSVLRDFIQNIRWNIQDFFDGDHEKIIDKIIEKIGRPLANLWMELFEFMEDIMDRLSSSISAFLKPKRRKKTKSKSRGYG